VTDEFLFNICMLFHSFPSLLLYKRDGIVHSSLDGSSVEEFSVPFSFFQPSDPTFLLPENFFLLSPLLQLIVNVPFQFQSLVLVSLCEYLLLEIFHCIV